MLPRVLVSLMLACLPLGSALACGDPEPCTVEGGEYFARPPAGWDGHSPLPTVVFLHGYNGSGQDVIADESMKSALSDAGVLLVAPQGVNSARGARTWFFPGGLKPVRDDFAYIGRVLDDVEGRWPVDRKRLLASGFSAGGSMTWYLACAMPQRFAAFAPVAGAFWTPEPEDCAEGPVNLRHVHGLSDPVVPMTGRVLRGGALKQGDVLKGISTWRRIDGCPDAPSFVNEQDGLACRTWSKSACASGRELVLCLHPGEHEIDPAWIVDAVRWVDQLAKSTGG
jgi:polyhydroxybutyrate depolymerase